MPWYENTLFVLSADHIGGANAQTPDEYRTQVGRYKIPIFFYKPNEIKPQSEAKVCQQIDVMPSVLDFLNYDQSYLSFGRSVFNQNGAPQYRTTFQYEEGVYQIQDNRFSLFYDGEKVLKMFAYQTDKGLTKDVKEIEIAEKELLLKILQAIIQQHNTAFINNQLY
jgi:phosphoglycerol transferase MdoB-like AlkP superfamily enzyme